MAYEFREVKCPWCGHIFMWNKNEGEGLRTHEYRLKETGEYLGNPKCSKCDIGMVVLDSVLEGIDPKDERVRSIGIRGI